MAIITGNKLRLILFAELLFVTAWKTACALAGHWTTRLAVGFIGAALGLAYAASLSALYSAIRHPVIAAALILLATFAYTGILAY